MKKLLFQVWNGTEYQNVEFEVQGMDPFIYKKINGQFTRDLDLEELSGKMLPEMVVTPAEARSIKYWQKDPDGLDSFVEVLSEYQEGLYRPQKKREKPQWIGEESKPKEDH